MTEPQQQQESSCKVFINGEPLPIDCEAGLSEALSMFGAVKPYAILINNQFIPASQHETTSLNDQDHIEVISAIQGG